MEAPAELKGQRILAKVMIVGAVAFVGISLYFTPRWTTSGSVADMVPASVKRTELKVLVGGDKWEPERPVHRVSRTAQTPTPVTVATTSESNSDPKVEWRVDNRPAAVVALLHDPDKLWRAIDTLSGERSVLGPTITKLLSEEFSFFMQSHDPALASLLPEGKLAVAALRALIPVDSMLVVDAQDSNLSATVLIPRRLATGFTPLLAALIQYRSREVLQVQDGPSVVRLQFGRYPLYVTELPEYFVLATDRAAAARALVRQFKSGTAFPGVDGDLLVSFNSEARFSPTFLKRVVGSESYRLTAGVVFKEDIFPAITVSAQASPLFKWLRNGIPLTNLRSIPSDISLVLVANGAIPAPGSSADSWIGLMNNSEEKPALTPGGFGIAWDVTKDNDRIGVSVAVAPEPNGTFSWWRNDLPQGRCGAQQIYLASSDVNLYQSMREACDGVSVALPQRIQFTAEELQAKALVVMQLGEVLGGLLDRGMPHDTSEIGVSDLSSRSQNEFITATKELRDEFGTVLARLPSVVFRGKSKPDGSLEFVSRGVAQTTPSNS